MERIHMKRLIEWKRRENRLPLVLLGMHQVGKTWLLKEFARQHYAGIAYFNFDLDANISRFFDEDLNPSNLIKKLEISLGRKIEPTATLIVFDEIQLCSKALLSLKYFAELAPEYHIVAAGSLLGVALAQGYPVGKTETHYLYPMSFEEFLMVQNQSDVVQHARSNVTKSGMAMSGFVESLKKYLTEYLVVGGMPAAVDAWTASSNLAEVERIQDNILGDYANDFLKHVPGAYTAKVKVVWDSIPTHLTNINGKFVYSRLGKGARARNYEDAIQWLVQANYVTKVHHITKPNIPLSAYRESENFKLYLADTGLLRRMAGVSASVIQGMDAKDQASLGFVEFKGALIENFVCQELVAYGYKSPDYWTSGNTAEVDFVIESDQGIIPIEAKSGENTRAKSLGVYRQKYSPEKAFKISWQEIRRQDELINCPLYMMWLLRDLIEIE